MREEGVVVISVIFTNTAEVGKYREKKILPNIVPILKQRCKYGGKKQYHLLKLPKKIWKMSIIRKIKVRSNQNWETERNILAILPFHLNFEIQAILNTQLVLGRIKMLCDLFNTFGFDIHK